MKTYKVTACYTTYCTAIVQAESEDEAYALAREMDGGDFRQSGELGDWHINTVEEVTA